MKSHRPSRRRFLVKSAQAGGVLLAPPILAAAAEPAGEKPDPGAWFADSLFNLLVDYYPEVPSRPYGSGATPENVLPVLRDLQLGFLIVYAKGHSGRTTFRSALKTEHEKLAKDMPAFFREMTRKAGTRLFLYYSGLVDGFAGERNPEWRMLDANGRPNRLFGQWFVGEVSAWAMCPLSPYFDQWVAVHLKEMLANADPDGIWVDGDWVGPCHCPRCKERYQKESGLGVARSWARIMQEWRGRLAALIKSLKPACLYSSGNITARKEFAGHCDWVSGDWFTPDNHRLQQSISMRRYTTSGLPYDAMTCDTQFVHSLSNLRSRSKSLGRMLQEGAGVLANGGQWCYWTYPMPDGAFVPSRMRRARAAAEFARARRDISLHTQSVRWTGILDAEPKAGLPGANVWGAGKALIALHRSPDVLDEGALADDAPYDLLVVPEQPVLTAETVAKLEAFVRRGGKLLTTGNSIGSPDLQKLLGVKLAQRAAYDEGHVLLKGGEPAGVWASWDRLELDGAEALYPLYLPWDYANREVRAMAPNYPLTGLVDEADPDKAGCPAATVRKLDKGLAVHIPTNVFSIYWSYGFPDILAWLRETLDRLQPEPLFRTDAPQCVEVALRQKGDSLLVHLINGNPGRDLSHAGTQDLWVDDIPPLGPIAVRVRCARKPGKTTWEPGGIVADAVWKEGVLSTVLPRLDIHSCLVIPEWQRPT